MPYLDHVAADGPFTPRTGGYRRPQPLQVAGAAWVMARAFSERYDPAGSRFGLWWAILRFPATLLEACVFRYAGELLSSPETGRVTAACAVNPGRRLRLRDALTVLAALMLLTVPAMLVAVARPSLGMWPFILLLLPVVASLVARIALAGIDWLQHHDDPDRGPKPEPSGQAVELTALSAWSNGRGTAQSHPYKASPGFDLFDQLLTDLDQQLPPGTHLILQPGNPRLAGLYAAPHRGFQGLKGTHWMGRQTDPTRPPAWPSPVS